MKAKKNQKGVSLVELVVAIMIISIAFASLLGSLNFMMRQASDPILEMEAIQLGQSYLENYLTRPCPNPGTIQWNDILSSESNNPVVDALNQAKFRMTLRVQEAALGNLPENYGRIIEMKLAHFKLGSQRTENILILRLYKTCRTQTT